MRHDDPFELVAIVYGQEELALLTCRLRWEGIWSVAPSAGQIAVDVNLTLALGGIRLFVHREDADEARTVLAGTPAWERSGGVYARSRVADLLIALLLLVVAGVGTPARIQSVLVPGRSEFAISDG